MFDFPASPSLDQTYSAHGVTYRYNGYGWVSTGTTIITASDSAPASPVDNALWYETDSGVLWFRYNDGNSIQWVQISGPPIAQSNVYLPLTGGTLTGALTLSGPPTVALHAATKAYVDGGFLSLAGGNLTGGINIQPVSGWSSIDLKKSASGMASVITGQTGTSSRWWLYLGDNTAETGGNAGSDFVVGRWSDAGASIDFPLRIARATGVVSVNNNLQVSATTAQLELRKSASGQACNIFGMLGSTARWVIVPGGNGAETGGNTGSDFLIARYTDAGALIDLPFSISRPTGKSTFSIAPDISNGASGSQSGYIRLFNGIILQWGYSGGAGGGAGVNISFPIAFPSTCLNVTAVMAGDPGAGNSLNCSVVIASNTYFAVYPRYANNGGYVGNATQGIYWMAIGY